MNLKQRLAALESTISHREPSAHPEAAAIRKAVDAYFDNKDHGTPIPPDVDPEWLDAVRRLDENA
jgi:hypothetical protein